MNVIFIDDDPSFINLVKKHLELDHNFMTFNDLNSARNSFRQDFSPHLFIIDQNLPDGSGSDFCSEIREHYGRTPYIIMLTSNKELQTKLISYQLGADDYLVKPIEPLELAAKLKIINSRLNLNLTTKSIKINDVFIDMEKMQAFLIKNETKSSLDLTKKEFQLLNLMARRPDNIFTREIILSEVWGDNLNVSDRTIDQHIAHLRKKLINSSIKIESSRGQGYKLLISSQ